MTLQSIWLHKLFSKEDRLVVYYGEAQRPDSDWEKVAESVEVAKWAFEWWQNNLREFDFFVSECHSNKSRTFDF